VGKLIQQAVAGTGKRLTLELGGKGANIIFEDAPIDQAIEGIVNGIFFNQGHVCCAGSRLLVQESIVDTVVEKLKRRMETLRVGDPLDKNTDIGAINSKVQLKKITDLVAHGVDEGAEKYQPACPLPERGYFFRPTIFTHVAQSHRIAQEEIFGPVVSLFECSSYEEGVEIINRTRFGLSSAIYTQNVNYAARAESDLDSGLVYINASTIGAEIQLPFGGFKHSGSGHPEAGGKMGAIDFFSRIKVVYRDFSGRLQKAQIDLAAG
jgi:aldehyde dehydrogenase (NAD+)